MEQLAGNSNPDPNPENLNGAGEDDGGNPNPEGWNEAGQIRDAIQRLGEHTDNQIAKLMIMIIGMAIAIDAFQDIENRALIDELELADEEEEKWEWEAEPAMWHPIENEDPFDITTLTLLFHTKEAQQGPDLLNPRIPFVQFRDETIDIVTEGLDDYPEYWTRPPVVQISDDPDEPHVVILSSEDLWGKADLVTIWVDGEELVVNKAMEVPYQGQPEPYFDVETKKEYLGFEIFAEDTWDSDDEAEKREELVRALHADWVEVFD
ncbi:hypothetical protein RHSIM_Rhsim01G0151100 [Rhododendron simsii]|uniref:Uncharacterized protein n=1 Tax=Rhododendron simsii TaxID=118357 RepID=A0A834HH29_RHOSS|nr:hypothetical protein RHSIM_Rhsim01G0151100 [Rhododendron simsii]